MRALIIDDDEVRSLTLQQAIETSNSSWVCETSKNVFHGDGSDGYFLDDQETLIKECDLLMLHLGPPFNKMMGRVYGNLYSFEFLSEKVVPLGNKVCVIAYSGGAESRYPEPKEFQEIRKNSNWPWLYINNLNNSEDIHLEEFTKYWEKNSLEKPPLKLLKFPHLDVSFDLLLMGYEIAHTCNHPIQGGQQDMRLTNRQASQARTWTESADWWRPVLGEQVYNKDFEEQLTGDGVKHIKSVKKILKRLYKENLKGHAFNGNEKLYIPDKSLSHSFNIKDDWNIRRANFNHDFLKHSFMNSLQAWGSELDFEGNNSNISNMLADILNKWSDRKLELETLLTDAYSALSPSRFVYLEPISTLHEEQRSWLDLVAHDLWLEKTNISTSLTEIREQADELDLLISKLLSGTRIESAGEKLYEICSRIHNSISAISTNWRFT